MTEPVNNGDFTTVRLEKLAIGQMLRSKAPMLLDHASLYRYEDHILGCLAYGLKSFVLTNREETVQKYPETLWDYFKERYFPGWLRKKFPVQYKTYRAEYRMCPHLHVPKKDKHVEFLVGGYK